MYKNLFTGNRLSAEQRIAAEKAVMEAVELVCAGKMTPYQAAEKKGVHVTSVYRVMRKKGIKRRTEYVVVR